MRRRGQLGWLARWAARSQARIERRRATGRSPLERLDPWRRLTSRLTARVTPFLAQDETLIGVVPANHGWPPGGQHQGVYTHTIAITDRRVMVLRSNLIGAPRLHISDRVGAFESFEDQGDPHVVINGERYWVPVTWTPEVRRIERMLGRR